VADEGIGVQHLVRAARFGDEYPPVVGMGFLFADAEISAPVEPRITDPRAGWNPQIGAGGVIGVGVLVDIAVEHLVVAVAGDRPTLGQDAGHGVAPDRVHAGDGGVGRPDDAAVLHGAVALGERHGGRRGGLGGGDLDHSGQHHRDEHTQCGTAHTPGTAHRGKTQGHGLSPTL
jgi:hypothetical protein